MQSEWSIPETIPPPRPDEVQVWRIVLAELLEVEELYSVLTPQERERAARMRAGAVREEFIAGRGCLRWLLGAALRQDPRKIELATGRHGKPYVPNETGISFNVAHSRGMVLIALAHGAEVGVDVEYVDRSIEALDIARSSFHPSEIARLQAASNEEKRVAEFYRCWTRKEAVAKADGRGLTLELAGFETGADGDGERAVVVPGSPTVFYTRGLNAGPWHFAALASDVPGLALIPLELRGANKIFRTFTRELPGSEEAGPNR